MATMLERHVIHTVRHKTILPTEKPGLRYVTFHMFIRDGLQSFSRWQHHVKASKSTNAVTARDEY